MSAWCEKPLHICEEGIAISRTALLAIASALVFTCVSRADITVTAMDQWGPSPATLGGYELLPFPPDDRPTLEDVTYVEGPTGDLHFDIPLQHRRMGETWLSWGHGYDDGDVYYHVMPSLTLTLPPSTAAFVFYASPNAWAEITATANDGTALTQQCYWADPAVGWGFHATGDSELLSVTLTSDWQDYAIGQFLIAPIPEPATAATLLAAVLMLSPRRKSA